MGLFEEAGRRFEQFKREATAAAGEEADYECGACGTPIYARRDRCPECGAGELVSRGDPGADDPEDPEDADGADGSDVPEDADGADDAGASRGDGEA